MDPKFIFPRAGVGWGGGILLALGCLPPLPTNVESLPPGSSVK